MLRLIVILCFLFSACERDEPIAGNGLDYDKKLEAIDERGLSYDDDLLLDSKDSEYDDRYLSPPEDQESNYDKCGVYSLIFFECPYSMS